MLVSIIVVFAIAVFPMVKRGTQSLMMAGAAQIGSQGGAEQNFKSDAGYIIESNARAAASSVHDTQVWPGAVQYVSDESVNSETNTFSNAGTTSEE